MDEVQNKIIKELAKEYNLDKRTVQMIVYYPLKFAKQKMENPCNNRPIRIRHFGLFTQKHIINKDFLYNLRANALLDHINDVAIMMATVLGFTILSADSAKHIIETALSQKDYDKLQLIWDEWSYYSYKLYPNYN
jgi:hypothetical protein